jgi:PPOX class probable F420-dependent enzyme
MTAKPLGWFAKGMTASSSPLTPGMIALLHEPQIALVTTLMPDGSPQTTPVWIDTDGKHIVFNTARGRIKTSNLEREPRVSVAVVDCAKPQERWLTARGRAELVEEGAVDHIHSLARKYLGTDYPWLQPGEQRVMVRIQVDKAGGMGVE